MHRILKLAVPGLLIAAAACYHATIETGLVPSTVVIEKSWAAGWLYGLVPPSTIETQSKCSHGVAKVETQHSFLNLIAGALTWGIYTPISVKVTCAQSGRASISPGASTIDLGLTATAAQIQDALDRAAQLSTRTGEPVYVEY